MNLKRVFALFILSSFAASFIIFAQGQNRVDPVNWRKLAEYIPTKIPKWNKKGDLEGNTISVGIKMSQVSQRFTDGKRDLIVRIVDGGNEPAVYTGIRMAMQFEVDTSKEYIRKVEINGIPGIEQYNYTTKVAEMILLIADRFMLYITGENFKVKEAAELKIIAKIFDLVGIGKLGK